MLGLGESGLELIGIYTDELGNVTKVYLDRFENLIWIRQFILKGNRLKPTGDITLLFKEEAIFLIETIKKHLDKLCSLKNEIDGKKEA